jgi:hypothetical protein
MTGRYVEMFLEPEAVEPDDIIQAVDNVPTTPLVVRIVAQDLPGKYHDFRGTARWSGHKSTVRVNDNQVVNILRWEK